MELRLEIDESAQQVVGATAVIGDSAVQLQAFAAPKTLGDLGRHPRRDRRVDPRPGRHRRRGTRPARHRAAHPDAVRRPGRPHRLRPRPLRRVDGPRWFLRAVFSGRAAIDDEAAAPLLEVVREHRRGPRRRPRWHPARCCVLQAARSEDAAPEPTPRSGDDGAEPARATDDLKPFERGPEITEVR